MPTLTATPVAIPQDTDQEFELDIRVATMKASMPILGPTTAQTCDSCANDCTFQTACGSCNSCGTCGTNCGTCFHTCTTISHNHQC